MEIVDIFVEYASGMTITDRATFVEDLQVVQPSERLAAILREFSASEAPPVVSAMLNGGPVRLDARVDGSFSVTPARLEQKKPRTGFISAHVGHAWTKDQRQQFGRFAHTLSAASIVGAVGYWHSTQVWTFTAVFDVAILFVWFVLLFYAGMDTMNGE
ncbi:hypothetical protein [Paraburkholderia sp. BL10I2N1]|uniref:hypothetical protein n=1 Tax=Paraburkholderia sp. BL10I2N1 TaxID=1938796 RepID=UPI00105B8911|nr:hypothetical protein [Paraburkholderia sp. BL10I2N1]TDN59044.1 hypothetical protein B0G77_8230 [Paraburkholderia sp. BL10I2N1]